MKHIEYEIHLSSWTRGRKFYVKQAGNPTHIPVECDTLEQAMHEIANSTNAPVVLTLTARCGE